MKECRYCGLEYKLNVGLLEILEKVKLSEERKESLKYIPSCDCLEKRDREERKFKEEKMEVSNKVKKYRDISIIDEGFKKASFEKAERDTEKIVDMCEEYAKNFIKKGTIKKGLLLYGGCGVGKTYLAACIANYLMEHGKTVLALTLGGILRKIKSEGWDQIEIKLLEEITKCDLLILDDIGVEKMSDWALEKIFNLVDERYRVEKPVIITTNLNYNIKKENCEIANYFAMNGKDRIRDRLNSMCIPVEMKGQSRRRITQEDIWEILG
jgi:DNA replication protein DnaC